MTGKTLILMAALAAGPLAPAAAQDGRATVPQITRGGSPAYVQQLPRGARAIRPVDRGQGGAQARGQAAQRRQAARQVVRQDFILDFGARAGEEGLALPTVREGVRVAAEAS